MPEVYDYSKEFENALKNNDESKLHKLFEGEKWKDHLKGFRLEQNSQTGRRHVVGHRVANTV